MTGWKFTLGEMFAEDAADGGTNEFAGDGVRAFEFAFVFKLHFSGDGGKSGVNIGDASDNMFSRQCARRAVRRC